MNTRPSKSLRDRGFTLIELLIAIVLGGVIAGVTVAALLTSMNIASSTTDEVSDSSDAGLIATFLYRDAQSAGAVDPNTAQLSGIVGISMQSSAAGWAGCQQTGTMVVRFSWLDRAGSAAQNPVVVTYALDSSAQLVRRTCTNGTTVDVPLGRHVGAAVATCKPTSDCSTRSSSVTLTVRGVGVRAPVTFSMTAALRGTTQTGPSPANSSSVALVALGDPAAGAPCPNLTLSGTGAVTVIGDAVVDATCGVAPIVGDSTTLRPTGTSSSLVGITDPLAPLVAPTVTCPAGGVNPAVIGVSAAPDAVVVYPQQVTLTASTAFMPGRYVFCAGLAINAGTTTGTNVFFYIPGGTLSIAVGANVDVSAPNSGAYSNVLVWIPTTQTVTLAGGPRASSLRGIVYTPRSVVQISGGLAVNLGGLVTRRATISGAGGVRLGLPIPIQSTSPATLPTGEVAVAYSATVTTTGGTSSGRTWVASGLPAGLSMNSSTGVISGTSTTAGSFAVIITTFDGTRSATSSDHTISIVPKLTISGPLTLPVGKVGAAYTATTATATGGSPPYAWTAAGLPAGLSVGATTGTISGTPSVAGMFTVVVTVTDSAGRSTQQAYSLQIDTAVVVPPGCDVPAAGWQGEYFSNKTLTAPATLCRDDANIAFNWGSGAPAAGMPADNFSVRWTRKVTFIRGTYVFSVGSDDGARLYVDGVMVFDRWSDQSYPSPVPTVSVPLTAGDHVIVLEFYERGGAARATLSWTSPCTTNGTGWLGTYYSTVDLTGTPTLCRNDETVDFDWGQDAPVAEMPVDDFSVRWTRTLSFSKGNYTFSLGSDDGGRLYIDGVLVLDQWFDQPYPSQPPSVKIKMSSGSHTIMVEYYERSGDARAVLTWS